MVFRPLDQGYYILIVISVLNNAFAYYYLRLIIVMFSANSNCGLIRQCGEHRRCLVLL
jgi:NADH:ubiquinone oxidoreductase subunit 2 (subunit N)